MSTEHTFHITEGQTYPVLEEQLVDNNGTPLNLTGATITLKIVDRDNANDWDLSAGTITIVDADHGWVRFTFAVATTAGKGSVTGTTWYREWKVVGGSGFTGTAFIPSAAEDRLDYEVVVRTAA